MLSIDDDGGCEDQGIVMQPSAECLNEIKGWESCQLGIYPDLNGFPTIGWGHKLTAADVNKRTISERNPRRTWPTPSSLGDCGPIEAQSQCAESDSDARPVRCTSLISASNEGISRLKTLLLARARSGWPGN